MADSKPTPVSATRAVSNAPAEPATVEAPVKKLLTRKMTPAQIASVTTRARIAKESIYHDEVGGALGTDESFAIDVPENVKGSKIVSELHKAAAEHGVKIKVWNREGETPPFVGFQIKSPKA